MLSVRTKLEKRISGIIKETAVTIIYAAINFQTCQADVYAIDKILACIYDEEIALENVVLKEIGKKNA